MPSDSSTRDSRGATNYRENTGRKGSPSRNKSVRNKNRKSHNARGRSIRANNGSPSRRHTVRPPANSNQSTQHQMDDEKHRRAMDVLYHLQQRLEQVSEIVNPKHDSLLHLNYSDAEYIAIELNSVSEALQRLTRVFKHAKDELNNSQCFPRGSLASDDLMKKQLLINTRLTKCAALSNIHEQLHSKLTSIEIKSPSDDHIGNEAMNCSIITSSSTGQCDRSVLSTPSTPPLNSVIPFSQPTYSQSMKCQTLLDDIFGIEDSQSQPQNQPFECRSRAERLSIVTFHNGKVFASPLTHTIRSSFAEPMEQMQSGMFSQSDFEESDLDEPAASAINLTDVFEPTEDLGTSVNYESVSAAYGSLSLKPLACSTQKEDVPHGLKDQLPCLNNVIHEQPRRKLVLNPNAKIRLISDSELEDDKENPLPDNVWSEQGCLHFKLPQALIDAIDRW